MQLNHLKYFIEVVNCKSISLASKNLFITQPALSRAIKVLESEFGHCLLERNVSGVCLTEFGQYIYDDIKELVIRSEGLIEKSQRFASSVTQLCLKGDFNIVTIPSIADGLLPQILSRYSYNGGGVISVKLLNINFLQNGSVELVISEKIEDFIIAMNPNHLLDTFLANTHLSVQNLFVESFFVIVGASHPLAAKKSIALNTLIHHRLICHQNGFSQKTYLETLLHKSVDILLETNNTTTITQLLLNSNAVLLTNTLMYSEDLKKNPHLRKIPVQNYIAQYFVLYSKNNRNLSFITTLIDELKTIRSEINAN